MPCALDSVWAWEIDGEIASALVSRPLENLNGDLGTAIGLVGTAPKQRGQGFASALTRTVVQHFQDKGNAFSVLWARQDLVGFYEAMGFTDLQGEDDCRLSVASNPRAQTSQLCFSDFGAISHSGFDALRHEKADGTGLISRQLKNNRWHGISGIREGQLSILYGGSEEEPDFYAVIAHEARSPMILEFVGEPENFRLALDWIQKELGPDPVSFSLTSPRLTRLLKPVDILDRQPNFHTLLSWHGAQPPVVPVTTWLDRI